MRIAEEGVNQFRQDKYEVSRRRWRGGGAGGAYSFVACLGLLDHSTNDHASFSRRSSTVPPPGTPRHLQDLDAQHIFLSVYYRAHIQHFEG